MGDFNSKHNRAVWFDIPPGTADSAEVGIHESSLGR